MLTAESGQWLCCHYRLARCNLGDYRNHGAGICLGPRDRNDSYSGRLVKVEWDFGDPSGDYNTLRGFSAAHLYDTEPVSNTDYTITLTITQQDGSQLTAQRTVRVTPNTRAVHYIDPDTGSASPTDPSDPNDPWDTIANAWAGTSGSNLDFRLTAGKTHAGVSVSSATRSNILFRSDTGGSQATVTALLMGPGDNSGAKDLHYAVSGTSTTAGARIFDFRNGSHSWMSNISSVDPAMGTMVTSDTDNSYLLLNVSTDDEVDRNSTWLVADMSTILGCTFDHAGTERPMRGSGSHMLVHDTSSTTAGKNAIAVTGDGSVEQNYVWIYDSTFNFSGSTVEIGHSTGGSGAGLRWVVFERNYVQNTLLVTPGPVIEVYNVVLRNNVVDDNIDIGAAPVTDYVRVYRNTIIGDNVHMRIDGPWDDIQITSNLIVDYTAVGNDTQVLNVNDWGGTEEFTFSNNVFPVVDTPTNAVRVNGGTRISVAAMDSTYAWATNNSTVDVALDVNYRPTSTTGLLTAPEDDMAQFAEDYYGNPRSGETWVVGAVDEAP